MPDWDQAEGKLKETEGKLTGDEMREGQGKAEGAFGDMQDKADVLKDDASEKFVDAEDTL